MNAERWKRVRSVFESASELAPEQRAAFIAAQCAGDSELQAEVDAMLAAHDTAPKFLERPTFIDETPATSAGHLPEHIGNYRITRLIAEGGMGAVYEAVQDNPSRNVAVKIMRWGAFSPAVERRFHYEAEVLARLRHKNIAQIYEAGVAELPSATPFFAMEYVEGSRDILAFVSAANLDMEDRVHLAIQVAEAVHYGHQQGVIHRDLKPANVLVDRDGHPKIIDFGIARATDASEAATLATQAGEIVGTPQYMSPEQFAGDHDAVDTRSDVYALGVLFYAIFVGTQPYDLHGKSVTEIATIVRERPPESPRRNAPHLSREIEWILLKALEKERQRRYGSASELAADLQRYLGNEAVSAGPPSKVYRLRKFVRRNRTFVASVVLIALAMTAGTVIATGGLVRAEREASKFRSINDVLIDTLVSVRVDKDGRDVRVADLLDRASIEIESSLADQAGVRAAMHHTLGMSYESLGLLEESIRHETAALEQWRERALLDADRMQAVKVLSAALIRLDRVAAAEELLAEHTPELPVPPDERRGAVFELRKLAFQAAIQRGEYARARSGLVELLELCRGELGDAHQTTLSVITDLIHCLHRMSEYELALELCDELLQGYTTRLGAGSFEVLNYSLQKAMLLTGMRRQGDAQALYERSLDPYVKLLGENHPSAIEALAAYARLRFELGDFAEAHALGSDLLRVSERHLGADHRLTTRIRESVAHALASLGQHDESLSAMREIAATSRRVWGAGHALTARREANLGQALVQRGEFEEAQALLLPALETLERVFGVDHQQTLSTLHFIAYLHYEQQDYAAARPYFERAMKGYRRELGPEADLTVRTASNYATTVARLGDYNEAIAINLELRRILFTTLQESDPQRVAIMTNLVELYRLNGDLAQGEEACRQALVFCAENLPAGDLNALRVRKSLAKILSQREKHDEAVELFDALVLSAAMQGNVSAIDSMRFRFDYGTTLLAVERVAEAEDQLLIAYEIGENSLGSEHDEVRAVARKLREIYEFLGASDAVEIWRERGKRLDGED
jgi:tetratricopeptide (TPR) repeat protein